MIDSLRQSGRPRRPHEHAPSARGVCGGGGAAEASPHKGKSAPRFSGLTAVPGEPREARPALLSQACARSGARAGSVSVARPTQISLSTRPLILTPPPRAARARVLRRPAEAGGRRHGPATPRPRRLPPGAAGPAHTGPLVTVGGGAYGGPRAHAPCRPQSTSSLRAVAAESASPCRRPGGPG